MPRPRPEPPIDPVKVVTWLVIALISSLMAWGIWWLITAIV
ncbi:hypothetical protein [Fibrella aquatica]